MQTKRCAHIGGLSTAANSYLNSTRHPETSVICTAVNIPGPSLRATVFKRQLGPTNCSHSKLQMPVDAEILLLTSVKSAKPAMIQKAARVGQPLTTRDSKTIDTKSSLSHRQYESSEAKTIAQPIPVATDSLLGCIGLIERPL